MSENRPTTSAENNFLQQPPSNTTSVQQLQKMITNAQEAAKELMSIPSANHKTQALIKEALEKLVGANQNMLDAEKEKLKSKEKDDQIIDKISSNVIGLRPKIQRNYKLTSKASFEVWLDCLKTELTSYLLLYLIDPKVPAPANISEVDICLRKNSVKDIIMSHIDEDYHKKILGLTEPMEILNKLKESRRGEVASTPTSIRTKLYNLRMNKGEKAHNFCERFDQIVREHELSDDPQKHSEQEKRSTFYQVSIYFLCCNNNDRRRNDYGIPEEGNVSNSRRQRSARWKFRVKRANSIQSKHEKRKH